MNYVRVPHSYNLFLNNNDFLIVLISIMRSRYDRKSKQITMSHFKIIDGCYFVICSERNVVDDINLLRHNELGRSLKGIS